MHDVFPCSPHVHVYDRRKFRSQTSDNMERWKAEQGRGREKRKIRREKIRRERVRRQKIQMREKVGKSRFTVFVQWFVAPEGRKVGSLKRRVRSQLARWEMKNCTPLWREAHFEVKRYKTPQRRTAFGSWDVEKVHAVVARSTFPSQNVQSTSASDHFWKLRNNNNNNNNNNIYNNNYNYTTLHNNYNYTTMLQLQQQLLLLQLQQLQLQLEKVHAVVARSTCRSQNVQNTRGSANFWKSRWHLNLQKWSESLVFLTFWLRNVLRATTACTFSTSEPPKVVRTPGVLTFWLPNVLRATTACTFSTKVVRTWCVLHIFTWKCASRHNGVHFFDISTSKNGPTMVCFVHFDFEMCFAHNGVQFFISHLASWFRTRRFSEPTFRPSGATNQWKTQCFATFLPFRASASSFFWLFLFYSSLF